MGVVFAGGAFISRVVPPPSDDSMSGSCVGSAWSCFTEILLWKPMMTIKKVDDIYNEMLVSFVVWPDA